MEESSQSPAAAGVTGAVHCMLVTPRETGELGTQQRRQTATPVLTASNSMTSQYGRVCEEVDPCVPSGSSLEHTHVKVAQEVNCQATSMLVTGHKSRLDSKKK